MKSIHGNSCFSVGAVTFCCALAGAGTWGSVPPAPSADPAATNVPAVSNSTQVHSPSATPASSVGAPEQQPHSSDLLAKAMVTMPKAASESGSSGMGEWDARQSGTVCPARPGISVKSFDSRLAAQELDGPASGGFCCDLVPGNCVRLLGYSQTGVVACCDYDDLVAPTLVSWDGVTYEGGCEQCFWCDEGNCCSHPPGSYAWAACDEIEQIACPTPCTYDYSVTAPYTSPSRNTCGAGNGCDLPDSDNGDHIYRVAIPSFGCWRLSLCGAGYDTKMCVGTTCCGREVGCADDVCGTQSEVDAVLVPGIYYVTVDGHGTACGDYVLRVTRIGENACDCEKNEIPICQGDAFGRSGEMCVATWARPCNCPPECDWCNDFNCDPLWNGDGECDCCCQFCDIDCAECVGPASVQVCAEVEPPACGSVSCATPPVCTPGPPVCGMSQWDPVGRVYLYCPVYTAGICPGDVCVRLWIGSSEAPDAEAWLRFDQRQRTVVSSVPPHCAIDARQPHLPRNPGAVQGWNSVAMTFGAGCSASGASPADFAIACNPPGDSCPTIASVNTADQTATINLSSAIPAGQWTCITHTPSAYRVCVGSLPADVNGDRTSAPADILEIIDNLNGVRVPALQSWQCDIDRSGVCAPADILSEIDLLNGANGFLAWNAKTLPACPSAP